VTISITPTDFTDDIVDTIKPILEAVGLLNNGELDIKNWDFETAMGIFESYERTESILDIISSFTGLPEVFYRQDEYTDADGNVSASGLLYSDNDGDPQGFQREEWFKVYPTKNDPATWGIYLTVVHEDMGGGAHDLRIGVGFSYSVELGGNELMIKGSIPIMEVSSASLSGPVTADRLIWATAFSSLSEESQTRIAVSARLKKNGGPYIAGNTQCDAISLRTAIGSSGAKVVLTLEDYGQQGSILEDMVIDSWTGAGGFISNILNGILDILLDKVTENLPTGNRIENDLFPLLGLQPSPDHVGSVWPELDIMELISNIGDPQQLWGVFKNWIDEIISETGVAESYLKHVYRLIAGSGTPWNSLPISGAGTKIDPWKLVISDGLNLDFQLIASTSLDSDDIRWLDFGVQVEALPTVTGISLIGGITAQLFSVPLSSMASAKLLPEMEAAITIQHEDWEPPENPPVPPHCLVDLSAGDLDNPLTDNTDPLNNLSLSFERGRAALRMDENRDLSFALELLQVDVDDTHWDVLDLTSSDTPRELLNALTSALMDTVSDYFSDGGMMQWIGSLVGLCSPRCNPDYLPVEDDGNNDFAWDWYGKNDVNDSDLRIDITDVFSDPICALTKYHANLLATPITICRNETSPDVYCNNVMLRTQTSCADCGISSGFTSSNAWVYIMEVLGNIISTAILGPDNFTPRINSEPPSPLGDNLTNLGIDGNPWKVIFTPFGDIPELALFAWKEADGSSERLVMGVQLLASMLYINEQMQLTAEVSTDMLDITLPTNSCTIDNVNLFTSVSASVSIKNALHIVGSAPDYRIEIEPISGVHASIESVAASAYWTKVDGFGWDLSLVKPGIQVYFPDWSSIIDMIKDGGNSSWNWPDLDFFNWDGFNINLPDGRIWPLDFPGFEWPSTSFPWQIDIPRPGFPDLQIPFTGFNLGWPWFTGVGSGDGKIGFGKGGFSWPNIDFPSLFPLNFNQLLPFDIKFALRIIFGKWLSFKFGKIGLFLSAFFKLNIDLPNLDLNLHLKSFGGGFSLPDFEWPDINLPSDWLPSFGGGGGGSGLFPFHLPIDWPEIDWPNFDIGDPWPAIKKFLIDLFSGISLSGEPFAFPALRWLWGLFTGSLPDLRLPDLGWGGGSGGDGITFPNVPLEIIGDGTYDNPWAIPLGPLGLNNVEFIVWLDPDGLPSSRLVDLALAALPMCDPQLLDMIENGITSAQTSGISGDWPLQVSRLLIRIKNISPKVKKALEGIDENELKEGLETFNNFLTDSDGLVPLSSQNWGTTSTTQIATHWNALETASVLDDIDAFLQLNKPGNDPWKLLLIQAPWSDGSVWADFINAKCANLGIDSNPGNAQAFDLTPANVPNVTLPSLDISGVQSADIYTLKLAQLNPDNGIEADYQISQVEMCVNHIIGHFPSPQVPKILIVGHSIGGLAASRYSDSGNVSPNVLATCTVATPHNGFLLSGQQEAILKKIAHILELLGFGGRGQTNTNLVPGAAGQDATRKEIEDAVSMLTQHREGIIPDIGGGI